MKHFSTILTTLLFFLATSCEINTIHPSSKITSEEFSFSNYTAIEVSDAFEVEIEFSDINENIVIEANDNLHQRIVVAENGTTLEIKLADKTTIRGIPTLSAYISTDELGKFIASGAARITVLDRIMGPSLDVELSGGSYFAGNATVSYTNAELSGASLLVLSGTSANFNLEASGGSNVSNFDFSCDVFEADLSGASVARLTINKEISIEASGASSLFYLGDAEIFNQNLSGGSTVSKRN